MSWTHPTDPYPQGLADPEREGGVSQGGQQAREGHMAELLSVSVRCAGATLNGLNPSPHGRIGDGNAGPWARCLGTAWSWR